MQQRSPAWLAPVRAVLLAAMSTVLTVAGHVIGGGSAPGLLPLLVLVPMLGTVFIAVADRCRGILGVVAALAAGQAALHVLLLILTMHGPMVGPPTSAMVTGHAVTTVVVAVVHHHAETAVLAVATALARVLPRRPRALTITVEPPARPVPDDDVPLRAALWPVAARGRRGPPITC